MTWTEKTEIIVTEESYEGAAKQRPNNVTLLPTSTCNSVAVSVTLDMSTNTSETAPASNGARKLTSRKPAKRVLKKVKVYCTCKGRDDGRPMIKCEFCGDWYVSRNVSPSQLFMYYRFHLDCLNLTEREVEEISKSHYNRQLSPAYHSI